MNTLEAIGIRFMELELTLAETEAKLQRARICLEKILRVQKFQFHMGESYGFLEREVIALVREGLRE